MTIYIAAIGYKMEGGVRKIRLKSGCKEIFDIFTNASFSMVVKRSLKTRFGKILVKPQNKYRASISVVQRTF